MLERLLDALRRRLSASGSRKVPDTKPDSARRRPPPPLPKSRRWHAVAVEPGRQACRAATEIAGVRFLAAEAPKLPLADCDAPSCSCRYRHFTDRRDLSPIGDEPKDLLSRPFRRGTD